MTEEDHVDLLLGQANGIKQKVGELQQRLQVCVHNLERATNCGPQTAGHQLRAEAHAERPKTHAHSVGADSGATPIHSTGAERRTSAVDGKATFAQKLASFRASLITGKHDGSSARVEESDSGSEGGSEDMGGDGDEGLPSATSISLQRARSGHPGDGGSPVVAASPVTVGAALRELKHSLSESVQSSFKGTNVPTHGEELRSQYQRAIGDSIQRRLLGRADKFHTSGALDVGADVDGSGGLNPSGSFTRSRLGLGSEAGSGPNSPLRTSSPTQTTRTVLLGGGASGDQRPHQLTKSSTGTRLIGSLVRPRDDDGLASAGSSRRESLETHGLLPRSPPRSTSLVSQDSAGAGEARGASLVPPSHEGQSSGPKAHAVAVPAPAAPVVGFMPPPGIMASRPGPVPAVGFTPPPQLLGGTGAEAVRQGEPTVLGFIPPASALGPGPSKVGPGAMGGAGAAAKQGSSAGPHIVSDETEPESPDVSSPMLGVQQAGPAGSNTGGKGVPAAMAGAVSPLVPLAPTGGFSFGINSQVFSSDSAAVGSGAASAGGGDGRSAGLTAREPHAAKEGSGGEEPAPRGWRIGAASEDNATEYVISVAEPRPPLLTQQQLEQQEWISRSVFEERPFPIDLSSGVAAASSAGSGALPGERAGRPGLQPPYSSSSMTDSLTSPEQGHRPEVREKLPWEDSSEDGAVTEASEGGLRTQLGNRAVPAAADTATAVGSYGSNTASSSGADTVAGADGLLMESRSLPASFTLQVPGGFPALGSPARLSVLNPEPLSEGGALPQPDLPLAPSFTEQTRLPRPSAGGVPVRAPVVNPQPAPSIPRISSARSGSSSSAHDPAVSITITDADLARAGGMVPALLEVVRERFRQKGFQNLAQIAGGGSGGSGGGAHPPHDGAHSAGSLSPALSGETLTERIRARVETFQTARRGAPAEDLAAALMSVGSEDGGQHGHAEESRPSSKRGSHVGLLERPASMSAAHFFNDMQGALPVQRTASYSRAALPLQTVASVTIPYRSSGSGVSVGAGQSPALRAVLKSSSGAAPSHPASPVRQVSRAPAASAASPTATAASGPGSARSNPASAPSSPLSALAIAGGSASLPASPPLSSPMATRSPTSAPASTAKSDQATQTQPQKPSSAADGPPLLTTQLSVTANEFFLASTVALSPRPAVPGSRAGAAGVDKLLHPDVPAIRTAADFFRGAASCATINTSIAVTPSRELPAGVSPTAAAVLAAGISGTGSGDPVGPARGRNARDQLYVSVTPGVRSRRQSASGRPSSSGGVLVAGRSVSAGRRVSAAGGGSGRVVVDDEPVDLATFSSTRTTPHYHRRQSASASPAAATGGIMRAPSAGSDALPAAGVLMSGGEPRAGGSVGGGGGGGGMDARGLTREVLAHLAHLAPARHPFETTTDEEREEEERRARRRARQRRASAALGGTPKRALGALDADGLAGASGAALLPGPNGDAYSQPNRLPARMQPPVGAASVAPVPWSRPGLDAAAAGTAASPSGLDGARSRLRDTGAGSGVDSRGLLPRQLASLMDDADPAGATESPATAAAPGDEIPIPPLSLDAPDMPDPGGGGGAIASAGPSGGGALPHDTFFLASPQWCPKGPFADAEALAAAAAAAMVEDGRTPPTSSRVRGPAAERGTSQQAGARSGASPSRLAQRTMAGSADRDEDSRRRHLQRSITTATNTTTWTSSNSSNDADTATAGPVDGGDSSGAGGRLRARPHRPGSARRGGGSAGVASPAARPDPDTVAVSGTGSGRRPRGRSAAGGSGGGGRRAPYWADEDLNDLRGDVTMEPLDLDLEPSALSNTSRGGAASPSSAAASVLSHRRYVAAARAHRSVSEANSAKRLSIVLDDQPPRAEGVDDTVAPAAADEGRRSARHTGGDRRTRSPRRGVGDGDEGMAGVSAGSQRLRDGARGPVDGDRARRPGRLAWVPVDDGVADDSTRAKASLSGSGMDSDEEEGRIPGKDPERSKLAASGARRAQRQGPEAEESSDAEQGRGAGTPNSSHVRGSLQRLIDLRASNGRGQGRDVASGRSTPPTPSAKQPAQTPHSKATAAGPKPSGHSLAAMTEPSSQRSSRSPSVTATAGGTTEADRAAREAPLPGSRAAAAARRAALGHERRPGGGSSSDVSSDAPPQDPHALVSPKFTQDMAEEEYGWDAATGDADVDDVGSPRRGRRVVSPARRGRGHGGGAAVALPPLLPYDPAEVPKDVTEDGGVSFTRELERLELQDELAALIGTAAATADTADTEASTGAPAPAAAAAASDDQRAAASAEPAREARAASSPGAAAAAASQSLDGLAAVARLRQRHTSGGTRATWQPSSSGRDDLSLSQLASTPSPQRKAAAVALDSDQSVPHAAARVAATEAAAPGAHPVLVPAPAAAGSTNSAAAAQSPPRHRIALNDLLASARSPSPQRPPPGQPKPDPPPAATAPAASVTPASQSSMTRTSLTSTSFNSALSDLLAGKPHAAAPPAPEPAATTAGQPAQQAEWQVRLRQLQQRAGPGPDAAEQARSPASPRPLSSPPDPELRRLLLAAWSRWYLGRAAGAGFGAGPWELNPEREAQAAAAAAEAQARLQALAEVWARAGARATRSKASSPAMQEAANSSRLHIAFTRWLVHARKARKAPTAGAAAAAAAAAAATANIASPSKRDALRPIGHGLMAGGAMNITPLPAASPVAAAPAPALSPRVPPLSMSTATAAPPRPPSPWRAQSPSGATSAPVVTSWPPALRTVSSPRVQPQTSYQQPAAQPPATGTVTHTAAGAAPSPRPAAGASPASPRPGAAYGAGLASAVAAAAHGTHATPTVSRQSGVRQVLGHHQPMPQQQPLQQVQQQQQPWQAAAARPLQALQSQPRGTILQRQLTPPQRAPAGAASPARLAVGGAAQSHDPSHSSVSLLPQPATASAGASGQSRGLGSGRAVAGAAHQGGDLEARIARHLLDNLDSNEGLIAAGLQLAASGGAAVPQTHGSLGPGGAGGRGATGRAVAAAIAALQQQLHQAQQSPQRLARQRPASTGRLGLGRLGGAGGAEGGSGAGMSGAVGGGGAGSAGIAVQPFSLQAVPAPSGPRLGGSAGGAGGVGGGSMRPASAHGLGAGHHVPGGGTAALAGAVAGNSRVATTSNLDFSYYGVRQ